MKPKTVSDGIERFAHLRGADFSKVAANAKHHDDAGERKPADESQQTAAKIVGAYKRALRQRGQR